MNLPTSLPYVLWTVFGVSWEVHLFVMRNFTQTLEREAPQTWESLNRPKFGPFGGDFAKIVPYLKEKEYLALNNEKVSRAATWTGLAKWPGSLSMYCIILYYSFLMFYYGNHFLHSIAQ